jgi:hypothetical protein
VDCSLSCSCHLQLSATGVPFCRADQTTHRLHQSPWAGIVVKYFWQARPAPSWPGAGQAIAGWFGRFPAGTESREDTYLLDPQLRGLSVKIRGGGALEVKAYRGSPGIPEVVGWRPRAP